MSKGIEISPKHGVNATIPVCFFCGKDKHMIAMLGRVRERDPHTGRAVPGSDLEVPMRMVLDYEPCDECAMKFKQGVLMIGVTKTSPDGRPAINGHYPTGSHCVMKAEAFNRVFNNGEEIQHDGDKILIDQSVLEDLMKQATTNN